MTITSIRDALKALAQSLQVSSIFPAGLFVLVNAYIILPQLIPNLETQSLAAVTVLVSTSLMLSYTLYAFNFPLIRLFEGYKLRDTDVSAYLLQVQQRKYEALLTELEERRTERLLLENELGFDPDDPDAPRALSTEEQVKWNRVQYRLAELERRFDLCFPSTQEALLATSLGNAIRAFEEYPGARYGMDAVALWPRLVPILQKTKFQEFVSQEKSVFDFLLNTLIVAAVLGIELTYLSLYRLAFLTALMIFAGTIVVSFVLYQGLVVAARQWGTTVRVAFDLHRHEFHRRLALKPSATFEEERTLWREVSQFFAYRQIPPTFDGFVPTAAYEKPGGADKKD